MFRSSAQVNVPAMYTNIPGYKFRIGIDPIGGWTCVDKAMLLQLYVRQGEYDSYSGQLRQTLL